MAAGRGEAGRARRSASSSAASSSTPRASVFEGEGLEGASLRAIAARGRLHAGGALFSFRFEGSDLCRGSAGLAGQPRPTRLAEAVAQASSRPSGLQAAAMAFFSFYADNPRDLDLGFYLFRGGMKPKGLGTHRDEALNAGLAAALRRSPRPPSARCDAGERPTC